MRKSTTLLLAALCLAPYAQAQNTLAGNLTVQQTVKLTGAASPAQLTSNANDYAPAGFSTAAVLRLQSDAPRTITGLAGGVAGRMVWLTNVGSQTISLATESAASTAGNRFAFGASGFDLPAGGSLSIWYDTTSSRWRSATNLAAGGGGTTIDQAARDAAAAAQATADSKQAALANATTLAKVTEAAGLPLWDGAAWPGGGSGGTGTVTNVSVVTADGVSGSVANASTTPAITLALGAITPSSVAATGAVTGSNLSGTNTGDQTSVTGNAGTATALATARTINGVSFNGTANVTVPAAAGTLTGTTLAAGVTASSLTSAAGGSFGTAAFTAATAYDPAGSAAAITLSGLGGVPTSRTVNGHALTGNVSVTASDVGLGSVENTALSTWDGSASLATVGTVTSGTWQGTAVADTYVASAAAWNAKVSFPGFGTTGTTVAAGNDARLSDARTPTAHNQAWSTITSTPTTLSGYGITDAQLLDSDLTALAGLSTTGLVARTGAGTAVTRTITGTANQVTVTNGDGVAGNPTLSLPQDIATTSSPTFAGAAGISMGEQSGVRLSTYKSAAGCIGLGINLYGGGSNYENSIFAGGTSDAQGRISFGRRRSDTGTYTERMVVDVASGNVGIGTNTPSAQLHVSGGNVRFSNYGAGTLVTDSSGNVSASQALSLSGTITSTASKAFVVNGSNSYMSFYNTSGSLRTGYIQGNTSQAMVMASENGAGIGFYTNGSGRLAITTDGNIRFNAYGAGTLITDSLGNITASSDRRLKDVGAKFTRGLSDVLKLTPRTYRWNVKSGMNTDDENVGFIAQEVLEAIPEAVGQYRTSEVEVDGKKTKKREKAELLTLSDRPLIAALVNAVRDLNEKNVALEERVVALEKEKATK